MCTAVFHPMVTSCWTGTIVQFSPSVDRATRTNVPVVVSASYARYTTWPGAIVTEVPSPVVFGSPGEPSTTSVFHAPPAKRRPAFRSVSSG